MNTVATGWAGLGSNLRPRYSKAEKEKECDPGRDEC